MCVLINTLAFEFTVSRSYDFSLYNSHLYYLCKLTYPCLTYSLDVSYLYLFKWPHSVASFTHNNRIHFFTHITPAFTSVSSYSLDFTIHLFRFFFFSLDTPALRCLLPYGSIGLIYLYAHLTCDLLPSPVLSLNEVICNNVIGSV